MAPSLHPIMILLNQHAKSDAGPTIASVTHLMKANNLGLSSVLSKCDWDQRNIHYKPYSKNTDLFHDGVSIKLRN